MRQMVWLAPDGRRYAVSIFSEPFDVERQSIVFQRDDGWTGVAALAAGRDLVDLMNEELEALLARAAKG